MADPAGGGCAELVGHLAADDVEARLDGHLRDAGAHGTQPDDPDRVHLGHGRGD